MGKKNRKRKPQQTKQSQSVKNGVVAFECVEGHAHSTYSHDGKITIGRIAELAGEHNVQWVAIADHDTIRANQRIWRKTGAPNNQPYVEYKGVNFISAIEFTCKEPTVKNHRGQDTQLHILLYGVDQDPNSPLMQLIKMKEENDKLCNFGKLAYILKQIPNHNITIEDYKDYIIQQREKESKRVKRLLDQGVDRKSIKENQWVYEATESIKSFLVSRGFEGFRTNRGYEKAVSGCPHFEKLNIDPTTLIKVAHACGAIAVLAHPGVNLSTTNRPGEIIKILNDAEIDGYETTHNKAKSKYNKMIHDDLNGRNAKDTIFTAGSDIHNESEGNRVGKVYIGKDNDIDLTMNEYGQLVTEVKKQEKAREQGQKTHRRYKKGISLAEARTIVDKIKEETKHKVKVNADHSKEYTGKLYRIPSRYDDPNYEPKDGFENYIAKRKIAQQTPPPATPQSSPKDQKEYEAHISEMEKKYSEGSTDDFVS